VQGGALNTLDASRAPGSSIQPPQPAQQCVMEVGDPLRDSQETPSNLVREGAHILVRFSYL
jgi:hypothetical protein